jgi:hypothetical protein
MEWVPDSAVSPIDTSSFAAQMSRYTPTPRWAKLPLGVGFKGQCASVAVDSSDNVYAFGNGDDAIVVMSSDGTFLRSIGSGEEFDHPHSVVLDHDDNIWVVDAIGSFIQKRDQDGKVLLTLGERGSPSPKWSNEPFNWPTDIAILPTTGEFFVSDGYYNAAIHKFDPNGTLIKSWGAPGGDPGEFCCPHNICLVGTDRLAVADRENFRLQFFTTEGEYIEQWHVVHPNAVRQSRKNPDELLIAELSPPAYLHGMPNVGNRVAVLDSKSGALIGRVGGLLPGTGDDEFLCPHGVADDSQGNLYVAETISLFLERFLGETPVPGEPVCLKRFSRSSGS